MKTRAPGVTTGWLRYASFDLYSTESVLYLNFEQEGALSTVPFIKDRLVDLGKEDMIVLLSSTDIERSPWPVIRLDHLVIPRPPVLTSFSPEAQEVLTKLDPGSVAYVFQDPQTGLAIELVGWLGEH